MHADVLGDSWLEFVLDPTKLDLHLAALKDGKATNPSGLVLIKTFAKQAEKPSSSSAQSKREKLLNGLAAKVWYTLEIPLDEIEKAVPPKYQRQLLAEMVLAYNTPVVNSILHRWVLRTVMHGVDPDLVRYDPEQSAQFLRNWIATIQPNEEGNLETRNQFLSASFDVGEYLLYGGDFASAENYLRKVKELYTSESFSKGVINEDRLQGLLLATNLRNETKVGSSKLVHTERACAHPDNLSNILNILETDNAELPWVYRWNLDYHSYQQITPNLGAQITCLNVVQHGVQGTLGLVPNWQQKLGPNLGDKSTSDFFFKSCANAANITGRPSEVVERRMGALARRACKTVNTVQAWDSLFTNAPQFELDNTPRQTLLQRQFCGGKLRDLFSKTGHQENPQHLYKVAQYARDRQILLKLDATVSPDELLAKAKGCYDMGEYLEARRIYQSNQYPNLTVKCAYGVLLVDIALFLQNKSTQESSLAILDHIQKCETLGVPDAFSVLHIIAFLIETSNWPTLQKFSAETKQRLEDANQYNSEAVILCELGLGISEIMSAVSTFSETQGQAQMARALDPQITRHFPIILSYTAVLYTLVGKLKNPACPTALANISAGLLYSILKPKTQTAAPGAPLPPNTPNTDVSLDRYGLIAEITAMCKCKSISVTMEAQLLDMMQQLLIHLQTTSPSHVWLAGIADSLFEQSRFRDAIEFYLLAIATESSWFVGLKLGLHTYGMLGRLVQALIALKASSAAVAILQLVPNGYAIAAKIIQEEVYSLDASYFQFIWDVPFLELLVFIYNRNKDDKKTNYLTQILGVPELNEYNPVEMRQAFIHHIKLNLFRTLYVDFLA